MLDIGFSEIALIFTLALIVLGPEKLPKVAAQVGRWIGRARGMARQFREQLEEEVNLEETRRTTRQAAAVTAPPPAAAIESQPSTPSALPETSTESSAASVETPPALTEPQTTIDPHANSLEPAGALHPHAASLDGPGDSHTHAASVEPSPPIGNPAAASLPVAEDPPQPVYPDHYSHAHPTDADGLPLPPPASETAVADSRQQDWVGGVAPTDKPAQSSTEPGYAPPHERGT